MKTIIKHKSIANLSSVITYSIYHSQFNWKAFSMTDIATLNMTIASCTALRSRNFCNIIIDFGNVNNTPSTFKMLQQQVSIFKYYVVATDFNGKITALFTNSYFDILDLINSNFKLHINRYQIIQIVANYPNPE